MELLLSECPLWCGELREESMEGTRLLSCSGEHGGERAPKGGWRPTEEGLGGGGGGGQREPEDPPPLNTNPQGRQWDRWSRGCRHPRGRSAGWGAPSTRACKSRRGREETCEGRALAASRRTALLALASRWEVEE